MLKWIAVLALAGCGSKSGLLELTAASDPGSGGTGGAGGAGGLAGVGGTGGVGGGGSGGVGGSGGGVSTPECAPSGGPTELANGVVDAHAIEVDETHVYFTIATDGGSVRRVPKLGGAVEVIATGLGRPRHLALWGSDVYVTSPMSGHVMRASKDGSAQSEVFDGLPHPNGIGVGDWGIVWVRQSPNGGELWRRNWGEDEPFEVAKDLPSPYDLVLSGADAYFNDNGSGKAEPSVRHVDLSTGAQQVLAEPSAANGHAVALDAEWVYFTLNAEVLRVRRGGGQVEQLGTGVFLRGITVAGDRVYWSEHGAGESPGRVVRHRLGRGATEIVAADQAEPMGITHDGACVYWTNSGGLGKDGSVYAAPL